MVASIALPVLILTTIGTDGKRHAGATSPAPASRLLPAGPPDPEVIALQGRLRIYLPITQSRITAIGYRAVGDGALPLDPVGVQANAGLFTRLLNRLFGEEEGGLRYFLLGGGTGAETAGLDVGAPVDTNVYAPVDGTVVGISDQVLDGQPIGNTIDIQPSGSPGLVLSISNLRHDPALTVGSTVARSRTKIGRVVDTSAFERAALARYTQDRGQHVHLETRPTLNLLLP